MDERERERPPPAPLENAPYNLLDEFGLEFHSIPICCCICSVSRYGEVFNSPPNGRLLTRRSLSVEVNQVKHSPFFGFSDLIQNNRRTCCPWGHLKLLRCPWWWSRELTIRLGIQWLFNYILMVI